jgi:seryl-tRNA synthetase
MLDIKFIRENHTLVKEAARKKHVDVNIDRLITVDTKRRELQAAYDEARQKQNSASANIAQATTPEERDALIAAMKTVKDELQTIEADLKKTMQEWQKLMLLVPNIPDMSVPEGKSDADNQEIRTWGNKPTFSFVPRSHIDLMLAHDMADFERGARTSGFRGYYLKNAGVTLTFALWQLVWDTLTKEDGFTPMLAPSLVRKEAFMGTGYLPQGEEDLYRTQDEEYLAGTAEVAVMSYHMDEVLDKSDLPKKYLAFSPCFRREAGSHGKDTKGLVRVHEFFKLEQVVLCEGAHQTSVEWHEKLTGNAEKLLQLLELPYRVVVNCGADIGLGQVKKYDLEAWVPSERTYRETHSSSYFHDFQTRRLNIRYRDDAGALRFVHSLNNTALAGPRILVPLIENNQQADGSIRVPTALVKYVGTDVLHPA